MKTLSPQSSHSQIRSNILFYAASSLEGGDTIWIGSINYGYSILAGAVRSYEISEKELCVVGVLKG